jgi:hypothetical protein
MKLDPDFTRIHTALTLKGEPDRVPLANFNAMRESTFKYGGYPLQV